MNNSQLYLAIGLPTILVLTSVSVSLFQLFDIKTDIRGIHSDIRSIAERLAKIETRLGIEMKA